MKACSAVFSLIASAVLLLPVGSVRAEDDLHTIYQEGRAAFYAGQFDLAREKLSVVLAKNPTHLETRAMMAQIEQKIGVNNAALRKTYEKIILERVEFTDINLGDAVEGVRYLAKKATSDKTTPNIIVKDPDLNSKNVSLNLTNVPLSEVISYIAQLAGGKVTYDKAAVLITNAK